MVLAAPKNRRFGMAAIIPKRGGLSRALAALPVAFRYRHRRTPELLRIDIAGHAP
jgi:hypothetical protein